MKNIIFVWYENSESNNRSSYTDVWINNKWGKTRVG